jgi:hypothetical protein
MRQALRDPAWKTNWWLPISAPVAGERMGCDEGECRSGEEDGTDAGQENIGQRQA